MQTLTVLLALAGFLITIGIIVIIHEGGHFLAAKWLGFAVRRFSIGMGKVLWRRRAWDTEFAVSALPIGGYVAFEDDDNDVPGLTDPRSVNEPGHVRAKGLSFEDGPRWRKAIVVAAGPLMNFVLAVILFAASGAIGVQDVAPYISPMPESQAAAQGLANMDRVVRVAGRPITGVMDLNSALLERIGEPDVVIEFDRSGELIVRHFDLSGISMAEATENKGLVLPKVGLMLAARGLMVISAEPGGPADQAGLKPRDIVSAVNGEPVQMETFGPIIRANPGKPIELTVRQFDRKTPERTVVLTPRAVTDEKTGQVIGRADVRFGPGIEPVTVRHGPLTAIQVAFSKVVGLTRFQAEAVGGMAKGEVGTDNLAGPVGIAALAGTALASGLSPFLEFVALISIAVGFMNLIPIPALDGGQLVLLALEGLMGRSFSRDLRQKLAMISMVLLGALAIYVTFNDVWRLGS
ncbi:RIP metalloprotease RseP [Sutterella sp.]|uniref:RIP metalloprotease RseP n=1 Tax=Sutterella sp. TaxID=1981025 RepID=UPI0026E0080C|nr:RIP metalloprotease RseP [Sutterella sp.]MDO5530874.1 RIP metalloprotease RseP [Sutterella sp.]